MCREDKVLEIPVDGIRQQADQLKELVHLLLVRALQEAQRYDLLALVVFGECRLLLERRRGSWLVLFDALLLGHQRLIQHLTLDRTACLTHPACMQLARLALREGTNLLGERRSKVGHHVLKVRDAQTLVAVREDREADDDVRMSKLGRLGRHVLADERNRELGAAARHEGRVLDELFEVGRVQQTERHAVDLLQHVRQERAQPIVCEVEHLLVRRRQLLVDDLGELSVLLRAGAFENVLDGVLLGESRQVLRLEPQVCPLGHRGLHLAMVPLGIQQHHVWVALQRAHLVATIDDHAQALEDLERPVALSESHCHASALGVEHGIQNVNR